MASNDDFYNLVNIIARIFEDMTDEEIQEIMNGDTTIIYNIIYEQYGDAYISHINDDLFFEAIEAAFDKI